MPASGIACTNGLRGVIETRRTWARYKARICVATAILLDGRWKQYYLQYCLGRLADTCISLQSASSFKSSHVRMQKITYVSQQDWWAKAPCARSCAGWPPGARPCAWSTAGTPSGTGPPGTHAAPHTCGSARRPECRRPAWDRTSGAPAPATWLSEKDALPYSARRARMRAVPG